MSTNKPTLLAQLEQITLYSKQLTFTDGIFAIESSTLEVIANKISVYPFSFSRMNPISIISSKTGNMVDFEYSSKCVKDGDIMYVDYIPTQKSIQENPKIKSLKLRIFNT